MLEDVATFVGSAIALVFAVAAFAVILAGAFLTWRVVRTFLRRVGRLRDDLGQP